MINDRFISYFRDTFFQDTPQEFLKFLDAIEKPIPRTIRIKPGKEGQVRRNLEQDGWILEPTSIAGVFFTDRREDFDPLERRLGFSSDHLLGNFYIQELAAAHPVDILADDTMHLQRQNICQNENILSTKNTDNTEKQQYSQITSSSEAFLILDMAASPGGKTTQLAEYFPNSFIIANEPTRERLPQLLQNLERMGSANIGITLYPGQLYRHQEELFDRILLDAPCSGEGTLFKGTDAVKHWHIKNIKEIARLQTKLLDAALHTLKVGGEMIYSTCSLNLLENEGVLEAMQTKYGNAFEIIFQKKFWPHIDGTGGFFVAKIRKLASLKSIETQDDGITEYTGKKSPNTFHISNNKELRLFRGNISPWKIADNTTLYEHEGKVLAVNNSIVGDRIRDQVFLMRYGEQIGTIEHGRFIAGNRAWRYLDISHTEIYAISDIYELDKYLRGESLSHTGKDGYIIVKYIDQILGLEYLKGNTLSNTFSHEWRRK